jgi:hypothetical protein
MHPFCEAQALPRQGLCFVVSFLPSPSNQPLPSFLGTSTRDASRPPVNTKICGLTVININYTVIFCKIAPVNNIN